jgi:DNA polymerase-3 subunit beta
VNSDSISLREGEKLTLEFTSGSFKTVFFGLAAESFPKQTDSTDVSFRWLPSNALIDAIDKVVYSVAARDERYNLSGIYMVLEELEDQKFLRLVSSDSKRLNISTVIDSAQDFNLDRGVIMSKKGVQELRRLAETVTELEIGVAFTSVIAKTPSTVLDVHLLEGGFPDYRLVVPKDYDKSVEISRVGFLEALKRLAHLCDETVKVAKFEFSNIGLHVLIVNANIGQAEETIPMTYDGETLTTGFNVSYFLEALSNLKSAMVKLEFMTPDLSFLLTGEDDPGYFGIVMTSTYNF